LDGAEVSTWRETIHDYRKREYEDLRGSFTDQKGGESQWEKSRKEGRNFLI